MFRNLNNCLTIRDLQSAAKRQLPRVAWEYLESGTGYENLIRENQRAFRSIKISQRLLQGDIKVDTSTHFLGKDYSVPFGIAPIGLSGLIWPRSELFLAQSAAENNSPYCLSAVATETPETVGPLINKNAWFQLYPPRDQAIRDDLLKRASHQGFSTLVVTADVPSPSVRERSQKAGVKMPFRLTPDLILQAILSPKWLTSTIRRGLPRLRTIERYTFKNNLNFVSNFVGNRLGGTLDWDYLHELRNSWEGKIILKGILNPDDAKKASESKVCDAIVVSNHGGRQFDAAFTSVEALPKIREVVGKNFPLLLDSGVTSGLDILKAIHLGADFVLLGRAFMYGVGSFQKEGVDKVYDILTRDLVNSMHQVGAEDIKSLKAIGS